MLQTEPPFGGFVFFKHEEKTIAHASFSLSGQEFPVDALMDFR